MRLCSHAVHFSHALAPPSSAPACLRYPFPSPRSQSPVLITILTDSRFFLYCNPRVALRPQCPSLDLCLHSSPFLCSIRLFLFKSWRVSWFQITLKHLQPIPVKSKPPPHPPSGTYQGRHAGPAPAYPLGLLSLRATRRTLHHFSPSSLRPPPNSQEESFLTLFTWAPILAFPGEECLGSLLNLVLGMKYTLRSFFLLLF